MADLPAWAHCESDEEEAARMASIFRGSERPAQIVALESVIHIKGVLSETPRWRLFKRWSLVRVAKQIVKEHGLSG